MLRTILILGLLAGCDVGEVPIGGGSGVDGGGTVDADTVGAASFQTQVAPLVAAKNCADPTGACHTIQAPFLTDYSRLAGKYKVKPGSTNVLVTKGEHQLRPFFDATEQAAVAAWIDSLP